MKPTSLTAVLLALVFACFAVAADESSGPAANIPELKPLNEYAGTWDITLTIKNSDGAEAIERTGESVGTWLHGGRFMEQTWKVNAADGQPEFSGTSMRTYDSRENKYRTWAFDSSGMAEESHGAWDENTRTFKWSTPENAAGGETITKSNFSRNGRESWTILIKGRDGQILSEVEGRSVRRQER
jgi:hypothetical protein